MVRLKELRENMGWNMKQAAQALGLPYTTYVNYEKNSREPNSEMLVKFADFYNVSIDYLMGISDESEVKPRSVDMPPITLIARAGKRMTKEQQETLLKFAKFTFPEAFEDE